MRTATTKRFKTGVKRCLRLSNLYRFSPLASIWRDFLCRPIGGPMSLSERSVPGSIDSITQVRFWRLVRKTPDCWVWIGGKNYGRYGNFTVDRKTRLAHRVSWVIHYGAIPNELWVLHKCDNPPCVRPDHLFLGTRSDNMQDAIRKGRFNNSEYRRSCGEDHYRAKLTEIKVLYMKKLRKLGWSYARIARAFEVSSDTAKAAIVGWTWKGGHIVSQRTF